MRVQISGQNKRCSNIDKFKIGMFFLGFGIEWFVSRRYVGNKHRMLRTINGIFAGFAGYNIGTCLTYPYCLHLYNNRSMAKVVDYYS